MRSRELNFNHQRCHLKVFQCLKKDHLKKEKLTVKKLVEIVSLILLYQFINHLMKIFKPVFCGPLEASLRILQMFLKFS